MIGGPAFLVQYIGMPELAASYSAIAAHFIYNNTVAWLGLLLPRFSLSPVVYG